MTPCGALRASSPSSTTVTTSSIWSWILLFHFCLRLGCGDAFCTDTFLQTDDFTHRSLTQSSFYAQIFLHSTKRNVHRRPYTQRFLRKAGSIYTQMLCTKMFLRAEIKAHRRFYTQNLFHREAFAQNNFYTFFLHKKHLTQRNLYTQTAHGSFMKFLQTDFLHAETLLRAVFTQQKLFRTEAFTHKKIRAAGFCRQTVFTQKVLRTEVLRTEGFTHSFFTLTYRHFYPQMSLHRDKLHTETCAHSTRLHTARFYTERLCFPFLITYLSCSPSQVKTVQQPVSCRIAANCGPPEPAVPNSWKPPP